VRRQLLGGRAQPAEVDDPADARRPGRVGERRGSPPVGGLELRALADRVDEVVGDADALEDLPVSGEVREVATPEGGYVARFGASGVGRAALALGAGREKKGDEVDPGAGVEVLVKVGDRIEEGEPVARLYGGRNADRAETLVREALKISEAPVEPPPAILDSL